MGSCSEFFDFSQKNKPQGNALAGGIMVLLVGGMQIGWIFDNSVSKLPWTEGRSNLKITIAYMAFYIWGILGFMTASATINRLTKSNIYYTSLIFVTFASAMVIFLPNNYYIVVVSRSMIGFAYGYVYLTLLAHASEICHQKLRGMIVAAFQICIISSSIVTSSLATSLDEESLKPFQWLGILGLIYSALGIIFAIIMTRESPVSLMREKKFDQALSIMIQVRNESSETYSIRNEYNELKTMVEEDEETSKNIIEDGNIRPLLLITLLRIAFVISFNYGLNFIRLTYTSSFITQEGYNFSPLVFLTIRTLVMIVTVFSIEFNGRRVHFIISHAGTSIVLFIFAIIVIFQPDNFQYGYEVLQIVLEVLGGIGIGIVSDVYTSEAFNSVKKPRSIFFVSSVEFVLHIAIIFTIFGVKSSHYFDGIYLIASGILLMAITVVLYKKIPETAKMTIRQTRNEFLKRGDIVFSGSNKEPQRLFY